MRTLWLSVLKQAIIDSCAPSPDTTSSPETTKRQVRSWFNPCSEDYVVVCSLAGLSPEATARACREIIAFYDANGDYPQHFREFFDNGRFLTVSEGPSGGGGLDTYHLAR